VWESGSGDVGVATSGQHPPGSEEDCLVHASQQGDRAAFAVLVERYWERLYRWLFHLTRDQHTAEDLTQDAFLKAFANVERFQVGTNFRAWLFRIAHNCFANHHRSARRRQPLSDELPASEPGPSDCLLSKEALAQLSEAVGRLPADYRAALLLRAEEDLSFRQIADILGLTEETARWRVFKARQKLLTVLGPTIDSEKLEQEKP
jgi:RNA polymerase sigma-70 factor, ECF subfamily